jgi:pimeloyl-ACP methyl ester carboxylesterase
MNTLIQQLMVISFLATGLADAGLTTDLPDSEHRFEEALVIGNVRSTGRTPDPRDAVQARMVEDDFKAPRVDHVFELSKGGSRRWNRIKAQDDGWITDRALRNGYAFGTFDSEESRVMLLDARGHSMVFVNGEPRVGDPYRYGSTILPIAVEPGTNEFLFLCARGGVKASLRPLPKGLDGEDMGVFFLERDDTLPDVIRGRREALGIGVIVVNATRSPVRPGLRVRRDGQVIDLGETSVPALSMRKVPLTIPKSVLEAGDGVETIELTLEIDGGDDRPLELQVHEATANHRVSFRSKIDDSVQYYAVNPAKTMDSESPGLILSLHGAGVEAVRQSGCYGPREFATVIAPTNRRSFGFDWEDWGRWDALEVLDHARTRFETDSDRQWLTGHSMGGHGTWQLGVLFSDQWAAVAPSAGWVSFWSYAPTRGFRENDPIDQMFQRATNSSRTKKYLRNLKGRGVYILHGTMDDNVPVSEARSMRAELGGFHEDFAYHERQGAGHWWGNECVDWPQMLQFMRERSLPESRNIDQVDFTTPSPSVSPSCSWVRIEQQQKSMTPSRVMLVRDRAKRTISGSTENAELITLDTSDFESGEPLTLDIDGSTINLEDVPDKGSLHLEVDEFGTWKIIETIDREQKHPGRSGPFKDAFRNRMVFVVGTKGDTEETALLRVKARLDSEQWWYRGNGSVDILDDQDFLDLHDWRDGRNVILYGNADTNGAWKALVDDEVRVDRTGVNIGDRRIEGDDLGVLMVRPIKGDSDATVAVVAGTGQRGTRLLHTIPYWTSGIGYPDLMVVDTGMLEGDQDAVRAAGFFGNDWTIDGGDVVIRGQTDDD